MKALLQAQRRDQRQSSWQAATLSGVPSRQHLTRRERLMTCLSFYWSSGLITCHFSCKFARSRCPTKYANANTQAKQKNGRIIKIVWLASITISMMSTARHQHSTAQHSGATVASTRNYKLDLKRIRIISIEHYRSATRTWYHTYQYLVVYQYQVVLSIA